MPFKSERQRRFMWARHRDIAQKWADEEKELKSAERVKETKSVNPVKEAKKTKK